MKKPYFIGIYFSLTQRNFKKISILSVLITSCFCLVACMNTHTLQESLCNLDDLKQMTAGPVKEKEEMTKLTSPVREQAMQETALSLGAQAGLSLRAKKINSILEQQTKQLSQAFNFNLLLLDHNVLPPVLIENHGELNLDSDEAIRLSDRTYKILKQARFVTTPPSWREYLWLSYKNPEMPQVFFLPTNAIEQKIWSKYVTRGWEEGVRQADTIFAENLARLKQEYQGMVLYRNLLTQGMVSPPFVARSELGVTGDGSNLRINDQVLRITALPALQPNTQVWQPAPVVNR